MQCQIATEKILAKSEVLIKELNALNKIRYHKVNIMKTCAITNSCIDVRFLHASTLSFDITFMKYFHINTDGLVQLTKIKNALKCKNSSCINEKQSNYCETFLVELSPYDQEKSKYLHEGRSTINLFKREQQKSSNIHICSTCCNLNKWRPLSSETRASVPYIQKTVETCNEGPYALFLNIRQEMSKTLSSMLNYIRKMLCSSKYVRTVKCSSLQITMCTSRLTLSTNPLFTIWLELIIPDMTASLQHILLEVHYELNLLS